MRIRSRIIITLVPLFAGLSLLTGGIMYYLQIKDLEWGLHEEASSIAVVTARFLDGEFVRQVSTNKADETVHCLLTKIMKNSRARRLTVFSAPDLTRLVDIAASNSVSVSPTIPPNIAAQLAYQPFVLGSIEQGKDNSDYLTACAAIRNSDGGIAGILAVETNADIVRSRRGDLLQILLVSIAGAAALGLILALVISRLITGRLANLVRAVTRVEAGHYDQAPGTGIIDELNDLGNTFDTMRSVLKEVVSRIWRAVIEAEQFRTRENIVCAFKDEFQPPVQKIIHGIETAGELLGCRPAGYFFGITELRGEGCAIIGNVAGAEILAQAETASAALTFIIQTAENSGLATALKATAGLFALTGCKCVTWKPATSNGTLWNLDPTTHEWIQEPVTFRQAVPLILHITESTANRRIQTYIEEFKHLPLETLMKEIRLITDQATCDAMIILRPS